MADANRTLGIICTPEEYESSLNYKNTGIYCLTRNDSIGLTIVVEAGLLSLTAVILIFSLIVRNIQRYRKKLPSTPWRLIQEPSDVYMLSLFVFDLLQATGAVMTLKWIVMGKVMVGGFCTAQGTLQQLGEAGVALTTLVIALHSFIAVWWSTGVHSVIMAKFIVGFVWIFVVLLVAVGVGTHARQSTLYESPTPLWCWIGQNYESAKLYGEYLWLWITLGVSFATYIPLGLWSSRIPDLNPMKLFAYPLVYSVMVLPISIVRWIGSQQDSHGGSNISSATTISVACIFYLSGTANVLLFLLTKHDRLLFAREHLPIAADIPMRPRVAQEPDSRSTAVDMRLPSQTSGSWDPNPPRQQQEPPNTNPEVLNPEPRTYG